MRRTSRSYVSRSVRPTLKPSEIESQGKLNLPIRTESDGALDRLSE
jgi:hypothetical protein